MVCDLSVPMACSTLAPHLLALTCCGGVSARMCVCVEGRTSPVTCATHASGVKPRAFPRKGAAPGGGRASRLLGRCGGRDLERGGRDEGPVPRGALAGLAGLRTPRRAGGCAAHRRRVWLRKRVRMLPAPGLSRGLGRCQNSRRRRGQERGSCQEQWRLKVSTKSASATGPISCKSGLFVRCGSPVAQTKDLATEER